MTRYYDDDFEKTAAFMDLMSLDEVNENYIGQSQDYSLRRFSYLPSACFRLRSLQTNKIVQKFQYPKIFKDARFDRKRNNEILYQLLDLKAK